MKKKIKSKQIEKIHTKFMKRIEFLQFLNENLRKTENKTFLWASLKHRKQQQQ